MDLTLQVGGVIESVQVMANAAQLQTDRADVGVKIESRTLQDIPLGNNRNYQNALGNSGVHR